MQNYTSPSASGLNGPIDTSDIVARLLAFGYLVLGLSMALCLVLPALRAPLLRISDDQDWQMEKSVLITSAASCVLNGCALGLAGFYDVLGVSSLIAGFSFVLMTAAGIIIALIARSAFDEFDEHFHDKVMTSAFGILFVFGGGWAGLAHFGFIAGPQMLNWLCMLLGSFLVSYYITTWRKGLLG